MLATLVWLPPARFASSGSDATSSYQFLRAVLLFPQDALYGGPPSYAVSNRAFIPDSNHPILVRLSTKVALTAAWTKCSVMLALCMLG